MKQFEILITSPPDRKNLVAEIWHDDTLVAEVLQETGKFEIEFYLHGKKLFDLSDLLKAIEIAKEKLL